MWYQLTPPVYQDNIGLEKKSFLSLKLIFWKFTVLVKQNYYKYTYRLAVPPDFSWNLIFDFRLILDLNYFRLSPPVKLASTDRDEVSVFIWWKSKSDWKVKMLDIFIFILRVFGVKIRSVKCLHVHYLTCLSSQKNLITEVRTTCTKSWIEKSENWRAARIFICLVFAF